MATVMTDLDKNMPSFLLKTYGLDNLENYNVKEEPHRLRRTKEGSELQIPLQKLFASFNNI